MTIRTRYFALLAAVLLPATALAQHESTATFIIEKIWNQVGPTQGLQVTGHLSCTGAVSTQQDVVFTATTDAVLFVYDIINIPEGEQVDCRISETVPDNYTADYEEYGCSEEENCGDSDQGLDHCFWPDVDWDGTYTCTITNTPDPASITVTKTWVIEGASQGFVDHHGIVAYCNSRVIGIEGSGHACYPNLNNCWAWYNVGGASEGSIDYEFTVVKPRYPQTRCAIFEDTYDSVIESENGCGDEGYVELHAGDEEECEIVNTVFFEGIPTLSQYGMAILALLMLGVGFVGFRRFT